MHHIQKAVGLHVNMATTENFSGFPQSLYTPAGAIPFDKTDNLLPNLCSYSVRSAILISVNSFWESKWHFKNVTLLV